MISLNYVNIGLAQLAFELPHRKPALYRCGKEHDLGKDGCSKSLLWEGASSEREANITPSVGLETTLIQFEG